MWYGPSSGRCSLTHPSPGARPLHHKRLGHLMTAYSRFHPERNTWGFAFFLLIIEVAQKVRGNHGDCTQGIAHEEIA